MSRSRISLSRHLFYSHLLCAILVAAAVASYLYYSISEGIVQTNQARLRAAFNALTLQVDILLPAQSASIAPELVSQLDLALNKVVETQQLSSATLYIGEKQLAGTPLLGAGNHGDLVLEGELVLPRQSKFNLDSLADPRRTGDTANAPKYTLLLRADGAAQQQRLSEITNYALLGFIGAVILSLLFARLFAGRVNRALDTLVERLQQVAAGNFDARIQTIAEDPTGRLALAFNDMSERLQRSIREREGTLTQLREARTQLEESIRDRTKELVDLNVLLRDEHEQRAQMEANLAEAAATDPLTKLLNRRALLGLMQHIGDSMRKNGKKCCIATLDIDHFKQVNDRFGHDVGDQVLSAVSAVIRKHLRADEAAARWGGEEFLLAWPDQTLAVAQQRADRLRELISDCSFANASLRVTASFGVAEWAPSESLEAALKRSDQALYCAKAEGRNRVCVQIENIQDESTDKVCTSVT